MIRLYSNTKNEYEDSQLMDNLFLSLLFLLFRATVILIMGFELIVMNDHMNIILC